MSVQVKRNAALLVLAAVGALAAANSLTKPSKTQSIADDMRRQLDQYNATVHPEQDQTYASPPSLVHLLSWRQW